MEMVIFNPQKGRIETIDAESNETNTTWFDDYGEVGDIYAITDVAGNLLIKENSHTYPVLVYDATRADIEHDHQRAKQLKASVMRE